MFTDTERKELFVLVQRVCNTACNSIRDDFILPASISIGGKLTSVELSFKKFTVKGDIDSNEEQAKQEKSKQ